MSTYAKLAVATAAVVVAFLAGTRFAPGGGPAEPGSAVFPSPSVIPSPTTRSLDYSYRDVGFIGLPPLGSAPSGLGSSELLETYWLPGPPPFRGAAYLYTDGRLIWFEYTIGNGPYDSTGYLEQRLTAEGVEFLQALAGEPVEEVKRLDFRNLSDRLPATAWEDATIRPYVPSGFGVCLMGSDLERRVEDDSVTLAEKLSMLPADAADLLHDRAPVPSGDYGEPYHCLGMTTDEARLLDATLRTAGLKQDEWRNRYLLEYHIDVDGDGSETRQLNVWFEPILPDDTIGCTSCG